MCVLETSIGGQKWLSDAKLSRQSPLAYLGSEVYIKASPIVLNRTLQPPTIGNITNGIVNIIIEVFVRSPLCVSI